MSPTASTASSTPIASSGSTKLPWTAPRTRESRIFFGNDATSAVDAAEPDASRLIDIATLAESPRRCVPRPAPSLSTRKILQKCEARSSTRSPELSLESSSHDDPEAVREHQEVLHRLQQRSQRTQAVGQLLRAVISDSDDGERSSKRICISRVLQHWRSLLSLPREAPVRRWQHRRSRAVEQIGLPFCRPAVASLKEDRAQASSQRWQCQRDRACLGRALQSWHCVASDFRLAEVRSAKALQEVCLPSAMRAWAVESLRSSCAREAALRLALVHRKRRLRRNVLQALREEVGLRVVERDLINVISQWRKESRVALCSRNTAVRLAKSRQRRRLLHHAFHAMRPAARLGPRLSRQAAAASIASRIAIKNVRARWILWSCWRSAARCNSSRIVAHLEAPCSDTARSCRSRSDRRSCRRSSPSCSRSVSRFRLSSGCVIASALGLSPLIPLEPNRWNSIG